MTKADPRFARVRARVFPNDGPNFAYTVELEEEIREGTWVKISRWHTFTDTAWGARWAAWRLLRKYRRRYTTKPTEFEVYE